MERVFKVTIKCRDDAKRGLSFYDADELFSDISATMFSRRLSPYVEEVLEITKREVTTDYDMMMLADVLDNLTARVKSLESKNKASHILERSYGLG